MAHTARSYFGLYEPDGTRGEFYYKVLMARLSFFIAFEAAVSFVEVLGPAHAIHGALGHGDAPSVDGQVADSRKQVDLPADGGWGHLRLASVVDVIVEVVRHDVGKRLSNEAGGRRRQAHTLASGFAQDLGGQGRMGVLVLGEDLPAARQLLDEQLVEARHVFGDDAFEQEVFDDDEDNEPSDLVHRRTRLLRWGVILLATAFVAPLIVALLD